MIRFTCKNCGQKIKVSDEYAGKKGKCPKCRQPIVIPASSQQSGEQSSIIKFRCPHCSQKIGLAATYAGKQVKCAKCKQPLTVPQATQLSAAALASEDTDVPQAGSAQSPASRDVMQRPGPLEELLAAEQNAPPLEFAPPPEPVADEFAGVPDPTRAGLGSYQSSGSEKAKTVNAGLFIGLGCAAAAAVAIGLFITFFFGMARTAIQGSVTSPEAEEICEQFIYALTEKDFAGAKLFLTENVRSTVKDSELEKLAGQVSGGETFELECVQTRKLDDPNRELLLLSYSLEWADDYANAIILVSQEGDSMFVDQVAAMGPSGETVSLGSSSYEELLGEVFGTVASDAVSGANFSLPCIAWIILVIVGIVQLVAVWTIFDKAGQPGWAVLIPIYNLWVWAVVADRPGWLGLAVFGAGFIPHVGWLVQLGLWIAITIGVAKAFGRGIGFGLGLCFLPIVFHPILAFSND